MRSSKVSLTTLAMASILPWVAASVSSADKVKVLLDPPPLPSGGSGVEVAPAGRPGWVQLHDFVRGEAPPLRRSDPDGPLDPPFSTPTPPPSIAFDGVIDTGSLIPPDTHIAVGPGLATAGRVIMVTNQQVGLWDKTGGPVASRGLSSMFTGVGPFAFDPKILFDQHSGRFFIVCLRGLNSTESEIHIAISSSGTPNNLSTDWTFLVGSGLTNIGGFDTWSDYPGIGADALSLFTTFNLFDSTSSFRGIKIRIFDKAALLAGIYTFVDINYDDDVTNVATTQPAHVYGATTNGGFYLISRLGSSTYRLFHITGHPAAPVATTNTFAWSGGTFPSDRGADQCTVANPDVDTLRSRIQNAIHRDGHIWCTLASDPDNDDQVEVVWQDILDNSYPTNAPAVFQSGFINGTGAAPWTYMPSINVNAAGDAAIVYTQSSTVECPNMYYVSRLSIDAPGTFQAPVLARVSAGFYDSFSASDPDRWGDYSAVVIDPTDDCFWVAHEFVFTSGVGTSLWGTHIASFCTQPHGACCFRDGSCTVEVLDDCFALGGSYQGDGTDCSPNQCPQPPIGACCFSDGSCSMETEVDCMRSGGTYQGDGTDCSPNPCPEPTGACCLSDGSCSVETVFDCIIFGGTYQGHNTDCRPDPCPEPTGACCLFDACIELTLDECTSIGGTYLGHGIPCTPDLCVPVFGACCLADGSCFVLELDVCNLAGGTYQGDDTDCRPDPCLLPCPWDLDDNGSVGATDLLSLLVTWGPCDDCDDCPADFDDNCTVGATDLLAMLVNWGPCP